VVELDFLWDFSLGLREDLGGEIYWKELINIPDDLLDRIIGCCVQKELHQCVQQGLHQHDVCCWFARILPSLDYRHDAGRVRPRHGNISRIECMEIQFRGW